MTDKQHVTINTKDGSLSVEMMVTSDELDLLWRLDELGFLVLGRDLTDFVTDFAGLPEPMQPSGGRDIE